MNMIDNHLVILDMSKYYHIIMIPSLTDFKKHLQIVTQVTWWCDEQVVI